MDAVASAILGGLIGALGAFLAQWYYSLKSLDIAHINDFIQDLERIERLSVSYWIGSSKEDRDGQRKLSAQVRGALHSSQAFLDFGPNLLASDWEDFKRADGELYDAATGGLFESAKQEPDEARVVQIMELVSKQRSLLRSARTKTFWAR